MDNPTLVVLAAGAGSRYGGLKQIEPVGPNGEIILDYSIYDALRARFGKVVFIIKKEIEEVFRERVGRKIERQCETAYVFQDLEDLPPGFNVPPGRVKPWGTAHATLSCREVVHSPFAVVNADDYYGRDAFQKISNFLSQAEDKDGLLNYCMVGYILNNTLTEHGHVARGVCKVDDQGFLEDIDERTHIEIMGNQVKYTEDGETWFELPKDSIASMNIWGFTPSIFQELEWRFTQFLEENSCNLEKAEYFLPYLIKILIKENRAAVQVLSTDERWFGVTYQEDKAMVQQGVYPENLWG
jgi:dTDP-glucose pyrophosphorylase